MGGGAAGNLGAARGDARGLGVPRVPRREARVFLRARRARAVSGRAEPRGLRHGGGRGVAPGRRLLRPGDVRDAGHRAGVLGLGQKAGAEEALPVRELAHLLLQVQRRARAVLRENRRRVFVAPRNGARRSAERRRAQRNRPARR